MADLAADARALLPDVIELRRKLHRRPELGLDLPETQRAVLDALAGLDLEIETGGATSAVIATLRGAKPGSTILLRADMDALPMPEDTDLEFRSEVDGAMHACGHDAHTAMLVGAAHLLSERRGELHGDVRLVFQPGEEGFAGARILIEEGLLEGEAPVAAAFAIHVDSTLPIHRIATRPGPLLAAADAFQIELRGRGGHGALPHQALDPIPAACEIVTAIQGLVTRRMDAFDPVVVSVTRIAAGTTSNVIPETARLQGTIRTVSEKARARIHRKLEALIAGIAAAHDLEPSLEVERGYPVTVNDAGFASFAESVARDLGGDAAFHPLPTPLLGAEDFSYILERVPGAMVFLGAREDGERAYPLHSNRMRIAEDAMATGMALHTAVALRFLSGGAG